MGIILSIVLFFVIATAINVLVEAMTPEYPSQQAFIFTPGRYYVVYNDGQRSMCMPKHNAEDYAAIFGGKVHYQEPTK